MNLNDRLDRLESNGDEFSRLKSKYFFHIPQIESPDGKILNPVHSENKEEFSRFLKMATEKGFFE